MWMAVLYAGSAGIRSVDRGLNLDVILSEVEESL